MSDKLIKAIQEQKEMALSPEERSIIEHFRKHGSVPSKHLIAGDRGALKLRDELNEKQRLYEEALRQIGDAEERAGVADALRSNCHSSQEFELPPTHKSDEAAAILVGSDWHCEERVDPASVGGANEFNLDIASTRIRRFFERGQFMVERIRAGTRVDTLVLALLGDLITGYIHEELQEDNYLSPTEAVLFVQGHVIDGIDFLLKKGRFKRLIIPCCYGNHGRTTLKPRISTGYKNSYEWLMYKQLERHYSRDPRVTFQVTQGYHNWVTLFGFPIRFHHGDAIKYKDGIGGPTIPILKKIAAWDKKRKAHLDIFGHLHEHIAHNKFVMNGALIGYTAFGERMGGTYAVPQQSIVMIDKKFGRQIVSPIYLDRSFDIKLEERDGGKNGQAA